MHFHLTVPHAATSCNLLFKLILVFWRDSILVIWILRALGHSNCFVGIIFLGALCCMCSQGFGLKRRTWLRWWRSRFRLVRNCLDCNNFTGSPRIINSKVRNILCGFHLLLLDLFSRHNILLLIKNAVNDLGLLWLLWLYCEWVLRRYIFDCSFCLLLNLIELARR